MEIKELNKQQMILLVILVSFVVSIATGVTTVSLLEEVPSAITVPMSQIVRQTVEKVVPMEEGSNETLTKEQQQLLEDLQAIQPLTVSLYLKSKKDDTPDKLLGTGLFLGENKVVIAKIIDQPKEGELYVIKSVLGEKSIVSLTQHEDFTIVELAGGNEEKDTATEEPKKEENQTGTGEVPTNPEGPKTVTEPVVKIKP